MDEAGSTKLNIVWIASGAVVVVVAAWFFFFHSSNNNLQTLIVHRGDFTAQVNVTGTITAAQDVDLGFAQNGRIASAAVKVGDKVKAGDVIATLENNDLQAAVAGKQAALASAEAQLQSLKDGTRPEQLAVLQSSVDAAQTALTQANSAALNAIQDAYTTSDDAVHNKADQFFNNSRTSTPSVVFYSSNTQALTTIVSERVSLETMLTVWKAELASLSASDDLSTAMVEAHVNIAAVNKFLLDANTALGSAVPNQSASATAISGYVTTVAAARSAIDATRTALTSANTAQKNAAAALATAQSDLALGESGSTQTSIDAQAAAVNAARADLQNTQALLAKTVITAPFDGTITRMNSKVGEVVSPTTDDISIISDGAFQIDAYISEINIVSVSVGDMATVTLDALGPSVPFQAQVVSIDPGATQQGGVPTYKTVLQIAGDDTRIRSGMTANVSVMVRHDQGVLVVPQGAIFMKNSAQVVQVKKDDSVVDVPVTITQADSLGQVEVTSGLGDGDIVVLNPDVTK